MEITLLDQRAPQAIRGKGGRLMLTTLCGADALLKPPTAEPGR